MSENAKVTDEQAGAALQQLLAQSKEPEEETPEVQIVEEKPEPEAEQPAAVEEPAGTVEEAPAKKEEAPAVDTDDVASLKARLAEREKALEEKDKLWQQRWDAMNLRAKETEKIRQERFLRKSTAADKARQLLQKAKAQGEFSPDEADAVLREIEGTLNPASTSYTPPEGNEDKAIILNSFLNEKGLTAEDADQFGAWIQNEASRALSPGEMGVARESLDGFLRIAYGRYQQDRREKEAEQKRASTVEAVKSVQRTQRETARAASAAPSAPRKTSLASPKRDTVKELREMPEKDRNAALSALLKAAVEQNH